MHSLLTADRLAQSVEHRTAVQEVAGLNLDRRPRLTVLVRDIKEPTHCLKRVGDNVPGVMVYHSF